MDVLSSLSSYVIPRSSVIVLKRKGKVDESKTIRVAIQYETEKSSVNVVLDVNCRNCTKLAPLFKRL